MSHPYRGVLGAPVTPFDQDDELDLVGFDRVCGFLLTHGVDGVAVPLHTGESLDLSIQERQDLLRRAVTTVAGAVPVLAHVSLPGTRQVVELSRHAEAAGAAAVVVVTPYHWRPSSRALLEHFTTVARAVSIDVLAYNFPSRLGVSVDAALIEELIDRCPNFVGVKDASYDMQSFTEACRRGTARRPDFAMLTGVEYLLPSMAVGGLGCFSPASAIAPRLVRQLYDACRSGDVQRARPLQQRASALWHLLRDTGYPGSVKAAMALLGRPVGGVRLPLLDPDPPAQERLRRGMEGLGLWDSEPVGWP